MGERFITAGIWKCLCPLRQSWHSPGDLVCRRCHATRPGNGREVAKAVARTQNEPAAGTKTPPPTPNAPRGRKRAPKGPNQAEKTYNSVHLDGKGVFQGLRFAIASDDAKAHVYKVDWVAQYHGRLVLVEVKDARRHHFSHQRSRLAFDAARKEWAWLRARWVWAEWDGTEFEEEIYDTLENDAAVARLPPQAAGSEG